MLLIPLLLATRGENQGIGSLGCCLMESLLLSSFVSLTPFGSWGCWADTLISLSYDGTVVSQLFKAICSDVMWSPSIFRLASQVLLVLQVSLTSSSHISSSWKFFTLRSSDTKQNILSTLTPEVFKNLNLW